MILEFFAIKCPPDYKSNRLWKEYIKYLKEKGGSFDGDAIGYYYGLDDRSMVDNHLNRTYFKKAVIFTLEEFFQLEDNQIHELW